MRNELISRVGKGLHPSWDRRIGEERGGAQSSVQPPTHHHSSRIRHSSQPPAITISLPRDNLLPATFSSPRHHPAYSRDYHALPARHPQFLLSTAISHFPSLPTPTNSLLAATHFLAITTHLFLAITFHTHLRTSCHVPSATLFLLSTNTHYPLLGTTPPPPPPLRHHHTRVHRSRLMRTQAAPTQSHWKLVQRRAALLNILKRRMGTSELPMILKMSSAIKSSAV